MSLLALGSALVFRDEPPSLEVDRLFGLLGAGSAAPDRARGPALIADSLGRHEAAGFEAAERRLEADRLRLAWRAAAGALRLDCDWRLDAETGVLSRRDRLANAGKVPVTVFRCLARLALAPGRYAVYAQQGRWSRESQGAWIPLHAGSLTLGCEWGRTSQNATPYAALRHLESGRALAFHVVPRGNWVIRFSTRMPSNQLPFLTVELGLADEDLRLVLEPGAALELPEILIQDLPDGDPRSGAAPLHRYWNARLPAPARPEIPVLYNTWLDHLDLLDGPRLRGQLAAAAAIGCEVFVVDAGWFGPGGDGWGNVGDWREKTESAFGGRMKAFADEVRAAGLGFGLWMEPERVEPQTPVRREHPGWFFPGAPRLNLEIPAARAWLQGEIARLIETYGLAWIKLDYNVSLGYDGSGAELSRYFERWYGLLDELRRAHPGTVFENCSSGGLRLDLGALRHYDVHFLTDTAHPLDVIRIGEGSLLRLPPGRLLRWAVLRSGGRIAPDLVKRTGESEERLLAPGGATWEIAESADADFIVGAALPGALGFSGDLAGLPEPARERLRWHVRFFKQWRPFLLASEAHLLTPIRPIGDRAGWTAIQLQAPGSEANLVFVYDLPNDGDDRRRFPLRGLQPDRLYAVRQAGPDGESETRVPGAALAQEGLDVVIPYRQHARWQFRLFVVEPAR